MSKKLKIFTILLGAIFIMVTLWVVLTVPEMSEKNANEGTSAEIAYFSQSIREEQDGKIIWELKAKKSTLDAKNKTGAMEDVEGFFVTKNDLRLSIKAKKAAYDEVTKDLKLSEEVNMQATDGTILHGDTLIFNTKNQSLVLEGKASIKRRELSLAADKIESKNGFQNFSALGHATAIYRGNR